MIRTPTKQQHFEAKDEPVQNPFIGFTSYQRFRYDPLFSDVIVKPENNLTETEETEPAETEAVGAETGADGIKISLLTEGNGMYVYTDHEGDQFSGEDGFFEAVSGATYEIEAVASEGWNFVNWKKDGSDYSTDAKISLSFSQDTELTAVFAEK